MVLLTLELAISIYICACTDSVLISHIGNQNFNLCVCQCDPEDSTILSILNECLENPTNMNLTCDDKNCNAWFSIDNGNSDCANKNATFTIANDCQMCDTKNCINSTESTTRAITTTAIHTTMLMSTVNNSTQDTAAVSRVVADPPPSTTISVMGATVGLLVVLLVVVTTGWVWTCWVMRKRGGMKINPIRVR